MEPVSAIASIVTLLGAGGKIKKGFERLISLKNASDVLLALNNEVTDLRLVAIETKDLVRDLVDLHGKDAPASLTSAIARVNDRVLEIEKFVAYELTVVTERPSPAPRLDRSVFLRRERQIQAMKDDIRADRIVLSSAMSQLNT